ncbi:MAG TPA: DUF5996 family protein [Candidatus Kapabacteria bacterium]|nr:DUF5996 family protein [Candidatus Kapabacteria bacterium]
MRWPKLIYSEWEPTRDTVHLWTQIVGKTRLMLEPLQNHWWNVTFYVTPLGLSTSPMLCNGRTFEIEFDFLSHALRIRMNDGQVRVVPLYARSVADFYGEYMSALQSLGIDISINRTPQEFDDRTPFDEDEHHASYDKDYVENFRKILIQSDRILKQFRAEFIGKSSPVHFFWGSFDLAVTRFSGQRAPDVQNRNKIDREAYSHEVSSFGFWPGDRRYPEAAFYAYAAPAPAGFADMTVQPQAARWNPQFGEFILNYNDVRASKSPESDVLAFCQSTYEAAARLGKWDRALLERQIDI